VAVLGAKESRHFAVLPIGADLAGEARCQGFARSEARDAAVGRALDIAFSRRQDAPAREGGQVTGAGAVTRGA
jgi:hypothetical protein